MEVVIFAFIVFGAIPLVIAAFKGWTNLRGEAAPVEAKPAA